MATPCTLCCANELGNNNYDNYTVLILHGTNFGTEIINNIICIKCFEKIKNFLDSIGN